MCKAGRSDQYCYRGTLKLDDYRIEDHTGRRTLGRDSRWSYQWFLVHKQMRTAYTLFARTEEQKQVWIKALQDAMDNVNPASCRHTNHKFKLTTFDNARSCQKCDKFLKGRIFQVFLQNKLLFQFYDSHLKRPTSKIILKQTKVNYKQNIISEFSIGC